MISFIKIGKNMSAWVWLLMLLFKHIQDGWEKKDFFLNDDISSIIEATRILNHAN